MLFLHVYFQFTTSTLLLLYLTSWEEKDKYYEGMRSWKGYPFDVLDELCERDLISGSKKSKSIYFTEEGIKEAKKLFNKYFAK